ncbi:uncharacterized protein LOC131659551 [Vicia villosa]|uniref:uncharacterized protein LOC131659551 n=1 Tax=Vicia villosa TaxID=3911 RepID=UPI00273BAB6E|nr:uncharacterized protein LOC131659551 [Vicia villosa]
MEHSCSQIFMHHSRHNRNFDVILSHCSRNTATDIKNSLAVILEVQQVLGTGKYLGVPSMIGRSRKATFKYIKIRVWKKINFWSNKSLFQTGREIVIKSVLQAIPSYNMSIFLLPSYLSDEIEKMMNSFWWVHNRGSSKGMNWLCWDHLSMAKKDGGMGFKNLSVFYYAMLGHNPSFVWRSIWSSKFVAHGGYKWTIGSGEGISAWNQNWLHDNTSLISLWPNVPSVAKLKVADLMIANSKWNYNLIVYLVGEVLIEKILKTPQFEAIQDKKIVWKFDMNGKYSVRNAYRLCIDKAINTSRLRIDENWDLI